MQHGPRGSTRGEVRSARSLHTPATRHCEPPVPKLKRKTWTESAQRLDHNARAALGELARKIARWAIDKKATVRTADPVLPAVLGDRAADNWRPLLALAKTAGGQWPRLARAAALALSGNRKDEGVAVALLAAIKEMFDARHTHRLDSKRIVKALTADPTCRWRECNRGKPISEAQLARLLRPFEIFPASFGGVCGYRLADCQDAFERYLLPDRVDKPIRVSKALGRHRF